MQRHWKAIEWFSLVLAFSIIVALAKGWLYLVYGIVLGAAVVAFVYLIDIARFDDLPSEEEREEQKRSGTSPTARTPLRTLKRLWKR